MNSGLQRVWRNFCVVIAATILVIVLAAIALSPDLSETVTDYVASFLPDKNVRIERAVAYTSPPDRQRVGDLYLPVASKGLHPAIVIVHGGSWVKGDRGDIGEVGTARYLANKGFVVFVIDYRLAGAGGEFPNDVEDTRAALSYLLSNQKQWNIDSRFLYVDGSSSGATTALLAAYLPDQFFPSKSSFNKTALRAVISFSGPTDLITLSSNPYLESYIQKYTQTLKTGGLNAALAEASPLKRCKSALPTVLIHGTDDKNVPFSQSVELASALQSNHIPVKLISIEGAGHLLGMRSRKLALEQALQFLKKLPSQQ